MNKKIGKLYLFISTLWHSLFRGMKSADDILTTSTKINGEDASINQTQQGKGVFADLLEMRVTKEVEELRDKNYRILKEADKFKVFVDYDKDGNPLKASARKRDVSEYMIHPNVMVNDDEQLVLIQDNFKTPKNDTKNWKALYDMDTTLKIKRDGYKSRFDIEQFANRLVIKRDLNNDTVRHLDLYTTMYASQFGKIDAILISNLNSLYKEKSKKCDFLTFDGIEFITDRPWPFGVNKKYEYNNVKYTGIDVFDGNFVLHFDATPVVEDFDITEKYKTKELDEKYAEEKPVHEDAVDVEALYRKLKRDKNNEITKLGSEILKIS